MYWMEEKVSNAETSVFKETKDGCGMKLARTLLTTPRCMQGISAIQKRIEVEVINPLIHRIYYLTMQHCIYKEYKSYKHMWE